MVIKIITEDETIFMDEVDFVNKASTVTTVTTRDGTQTEFASPDGIVTVKVFTDNGVEIGEE